MFRLLFLTFFGKFRGTHEQEHHLHESPASMTIPLVILAVLSALGGFIGVPEALHGTHHLAEFMSPLYAGSHQVNPAAFEPTTLSHSEEYILMAVSVGVALLSSDCCLCYVHSKRKCSGSGFRRKISSSESGLQQILC